jgi:hypothetical protein
MHKRLMGLLAALGLFLSMALSTAPAAQAATIWTTPTQCLTYRNIVTCSYAAWHQQADGTGVVLDYFKVWTSQGCGALESTPYDPVTILWQDADSSSVRIKSQFNYGAEPCSFTHYPDDGSGNYIGYDTGPMNFNWAIHARIDTAHDKELYMGWTLYANGNSNLFVSTATDCPCS